MTLKLQLQLQGEKGSDPISRYEHYVESYCQKRSECVWAKIIEQELSLSVVACLPSNNECVMHDAKGGGEELVSL